jgi:hypothetical protein
MSVLKRRRLVGLGGVSERALAEILLQIRDDPCLLPEDEAGAELVRKEVKSDVFCEFRHVLYTVPLPLQQRPGQPPVEFQWRLASLQRLLPLWLNKVPQVRDVMSRVWQRRPSSPAEPWNLIFYEDEITPGNVLRADNKRKLHAFYASFLEFGELLDMEYFWVHFATLRSCVEKTVQGRLSRVVRDILLGWFGEGGFGVDGAGVAIELLDAAGNPMAVRCWARLWDTIADSDGQRMIWGIKGAGGLRPCFACAHVTKKGSCLSGAQVSIACRDPTLFGQKTDAEQWAAVDELLQMRADGAGKTRISTRETELGININPDGLLQCVALRPYVKPSAYRHDPMHVLLSEGIVQHEVGALMQALSRIGIRYSDLQSFFVTATSGTADPAARSIRPRRSRTSLQAFVRGALQCRKGSMPSHQRCWTLSCRFSSTWRL